MTFFNLRLSAHTLIVMIILVLGSFCQCQLFAQPGRGWTIQCEGYVLDAKTNEPLIQAAVKVTSADGGTGTFGIADNDGHFTFEVKGMGKYTLEFSYVGYKPLTKEVQIFPGRGGNLGKFKLEEDPKTLGEVETVARNQRVKQEGDTVVYNADAYKVQDGATAEDLVAKMPGIEVTDEGVKAQGETVQKVLVDGKSFFENDPKMALRTLPAEVVQSVAVFDKKSDQSEFTGFDDGNTVKAMDLKTKSYRRNGVFGKVYGGVGSAFDFDQAYYNAGFNLNFFNGDRRISILAMSNNVNQQNFTFDDLQASGGMGGGFRGMGNRIGNQAGVSRANALAINFNNTYLGDKLDLQGSYSFNNTRNHNESESQSDNINIARSTMSSSERTSHNYNHRLDMRISYKPTDTDEFMFRPSVSFQNSDNNGWSESTTWRSPLDSILSLTDRQHVSTLQNTSFNMSQSESNSWNAGGSLVWRHRFDKEGRTLSAEFNGTVSGSNSETNNIKTGTIVMAGESFQNTTSDQHNWRTGGNLQYTEALGEHSQLSIRYNLNFSRSENERVIGFDQYGRENSITSAYSFFHTNQDSIDAANSSNYITKNLRQGGEVAYRLHTETINAMAGVNFEGSTLSGDQKYIYWNAANGMDPALRPDYNTSHSYFSVLPNMRIEWSPKQGTSVNVDYRASSSAPSLSNLQESVNTNNELAYSTGNKDLDQTINHNVNVRFIHSNMEKATNIMFYTGLTFRNNGISTQYITNNSEESIPLSQLTVLPAENRAQYTNLYLRKGARFSRPVNMDGYRSAYGGLNYGFPFDPLLSNINVSVNANYSVSPSQQYYYNNAADLTDYLDLSTKVRNFSFSPRFHLTSNISQDLDFSLEYSPSIQRVKDAGNAQNNYKYFNQRANFRVNWTFWKGFTTEQQLNYSYFGGSSMVETRDEWIWNASIGKKFLQGNKAEIKLQAYDILNTRTGFSQGVNDTSVSYSYNNFMPRYFLLTFTYKIANYKGSSEIRERGGMGGGRGGAGAGPRGGAGGGPRGGAGGGPRGGGPR